MISVNNGYGYIYSGFGSMLDSFPEGVFISSFDMLWKLSGSSESVSLAREDVVSVYRRKNGLIGLRCSSDIFYQLSNEQLEEVIPDSYDKFGCGKFKDFYREYERGRSSKVVHRLTRSDSSVEYEFSGQGLAFLGDWSDLFIFHQRGRGVVFWERGEWKLLFAPSLQDIHYVRCFGKCILLFGSDQAGRAQCEVFDLGSSELIGCFVFDYSGGAVSNALLHDDDWHFLWGEELFSFDGRVINRVLPKSSVAGYYVTEQGICILSGNEGVMRFYDHGLRHIKEEVVVPLPGYVFSSFILAEDRLVGYLRAANRQAGLFYAVTLPICVDGCPSLELEQALYQIEKHPRGQAFDLIVRFSEGVAFPTLLRQTLAVLDDSYSLHRNPESNPEAALFSGRVELYFIDPLTEEQKNLLQHGCQRLCALYLGREAPATGESFNFRLVFA
ncbi:hypothetical protein, partial [Pseudomonas indica]